MRFFRVMFEVELSVNREIRCMIELHADSHDGAAEAAERLLARHRKFSSDMVVAFHTFDSGCNGL